MKIVGFTQARNEMDKDENLLNWLKCMDMCESIYIYDQNSTDNSREVYEANPKCKVIYSPINNFVKENVCKAELMDKVYKENSDIDFILWADCDYIFDGRYIKDNFKKFFEMAEQAKAEKTSVSFKHVNLWRSCNYRRLDSLYDVSYATGRVSLWNTEGRRLVMPRNSGLHTSALPVNIGPSKLEDFHLLHRGFATDKQIIGKYDLYKGFGQKGWDLERLLDERQLDVVRIPDEYLPEWYDLKDDVDPRTKKKIREIYQEKTNANS